MKIAQLTPGSGDNFYCENCLRDAALVRAMRELGHDVLLLPMYLPLQAERDGQLSSSEVFFGGVNVYLQQKLSFFRKTPRWLDRIFDSQWLLKLVSKKAGMTSAKELGETTLSMLRGEHGKQVKELERLVDWLAQEENKVDIVILSNALLAGLAKQIKNKLGIPLVCLLQDEDGFLDGLGHYSERCWSELKERASDIDLFISVSRYYADAMCSRLGISQEKVKTVYTGISLEGFEEKTEVPDPPTIGYLSRMCPQRGLDVLVDAFFLLKNKESFKDVRLNIAGGQIGPDKKFVEKLQQKLADYGIRDDVDFLDEFGREERFSFLRGLSVLSVPEKKPVAYGLYVLEALADSVPVVEPAIGVFNELAEQTGAVVLYEKNDAQGLAAALEKVLGNKDYTLQLGKAGRKAVFEKFDIKISAESLAEVLAGIVKQDNL
jgi:glycosyltransferase involved in cell wall biosynthesis